MSIMNGTETIIEELVGDLPEAEKNAGREILKSCEFRDGSDPALGLLRYMKLRVRTQGAPERPLAASLAKMAEEMDNRLWEARRLKWGLFVASVFLAFLLGGVVVGGLFFHVARVNPSEMNSYLGLPVEYQLVHDRRLVRLQDAGVQLQLAESASQIGVVLHGIQAEYLPGSNGQVTVVFRKQQ
jgi:hypothetical protein